MQHKNRKIKLNFGLTDKILFLNVFGLIAVLNNYIMNYLLIFIRKLTRTMSKEQ